MSKRLDLTGKKFGRITVIQYAGKSKCNHIQWKCKCDCGKEIIVTTGHLRSGHTQSCGCKAKELARDAHTTHGMSETRLYHIWSNMIDRCENQNVSHYFRYGGRGITICKEWRNSFEAFGNWALSNGYRDDLSIDRIDVNGNYCPENCRWATPKEQSNNKRNNHLIEYNGETKTMKQWCDQFGVSFDLVKQRINKLGWSPEMAFFTPSAQARRA